MPRPEQDRAPLSGTTVLEFHAPGARCAAVLEALGAEVLTVQHAKPGAPPAPAGSRSIAMDLASPDARPVLERMAGRADVVLADAGAAPGLGLDYRSLCAANPGLVYCALSAAGDVEAARAAAAVVAALRARDRGDGGGCEVRAPVPREAAPSGVRSRELLVELGFDDADIANLVRGGVVLVN